MSRPKCVITATVVEPYITRIEEICDVTVCGWVETGTFMNDGDMIKILQGAEILITEFEKIHANIIEACPDLKMVACLRGNPVNIDVPACTKRGIPVVFTPGRNANSVAEYIIGAVLSLIRCIARANCEIRRGRFLGKARENIYDTVFREDMVWSMGMPGKSPYSEYRGFELFGKTFGMVGYGAVGRNLSVKLLAMGMNILVYDPYIAPSDMEREGIEAVSLAEMFSRSDFVSVQCKVTEETKNMIGERELALMRPSAYFINTSRAVVVDQRALVEALANKKIAGAVLDVFWEEPMPSNHPLLFMDNVLITPHIAGASDDVSVQQSIMIAEDVGRFVNKQRPLRVFNPAVYDFIE
ncbi:MAG TPA: dihydrofolate reductase [Ruminiclostridium sp.]|nr:dihydrofolate reductase [Ruminiclostridium sp.]